VESTVTCYFRHLAQVFEKAGIEVTPANKKEIDRIIHDIVGVNYKNCPAAWRQVKSRVVEDEANFVSMLKDAWENRK
jgi:ribosomal protein L17